MNEIEDVAAETEANALPDHIPCHAFEIILPKLIGPRPVRSPSWLRRCLRAILRN
eukprot:CAMPEP_0172509398 /NCGR_PEP_ID=MMETSP1066-20121228/219999_1 /TAXON_ID=671091 /ORGANISM="Coscinodiscus wailesii, Strain CCMP2513" /LENGTH=54 /DNA_ID=CAMNT_0013287855 /DNA_START=11 /DNA_END=172 /DNA_ORIENTATION=+